MSEVIPGSSPERAETFSTKKEVIIAYLEKQLKNKRADYDSVVGTQKHMAPTPPVGPIPGEVLKDGGSDLSEWRAQVGGGRQERNEHDEHEAGHISQDISWLEQNMEFVRGLEDYPQVLDEPGGNHDLLQFEGLYRDAKGTTK